MEPGGKARRNTQLSTQFNNLTMKKVQSNMTFNPNQIQKNNYFIQSAESNNQTARNIRNQNNEYTTKITPPNKKQQKQNQQEKYHPFKIPPNIKECQLHRDVTQFGKPIQGGYYQYNTIKQVQTSKLGINQTLIPVQIPKNNNITVCLCCGEQPKQILPVCCRVQQIYDVNQPLGYYFSYIKTLCVMIFFIGVSLGAYTTVQIITNCQQQNCIYVYGIPVLKFHVFFSDILMILNVVVIFIIYICSAYLYYQNAHVHKKIFLNHKKPSDYCVLISNVDHQKVNGQAIVNQFKQFEIVDILYTHKIQKYTKSLSKKSMLIAKRNLCFKKGLNKQIQKIDHLIQKLNHHLIHIKNKFNLKQQKDIRTDKIIVKFKNIQTKLNFQSKYRQNMCQTIWHTFCGGSLIEINENKMYVEPIGEPHEIVWENLQLKSKQRYLRVLVGNILTLIILAISYLIMTILSKQQSDVQGTGDIVLSIVFSVVIQVTNFILDFFIEKLTDWQRRYTLTGKAGTILIKNFISFFLNTTLIPFTLFLFTWGKTDQDDLVRNIFTLFLITNFISPFVSMYLNPMYLYTLYKRRDIVKKGQQCIQTQARANEYFQKVDFQLNSKYSLILQKMTNCLFYAAVFPFGLLITFFGLLITYWVSKWWLIKYCSIPRYSYRLGKLINDLTTLFPVIFAFGYLANYYMSPSQTKPSQIFAITVAVVTVPISLIFFLFGNQASQWFVRKQYQSVFNNSQIQQQINQNNQFNQNHVPDYRQLNPTTFLHSQIHKQINQNQFQDLFKNLEFYTFQKQASHLRRRSTLSSKISDKQKGQKAQ